MLFIAAREKNVVLGDSRIEWKHENTVKTIFSEHKKACYAEGSTVINSFLLGIENGTHGKDRI